MTSFNRRLAEEVRTPRVSTAIGLKDIIIIITVMQTLTLLG